MHANTFEVLYSSSLWWRIEPNNVYSPVRDWMKEILSHFRCNLFLRSMGYFLWIRSTRKCKCENKTAWRLTVKMVLCRWQYPVSPPWPLLYSNESKQIGSILLHYATITLLHIGTAAAITYSRHLLIHFLRGPLISKSLRRFHSK